MTVDTGGRVHREGEPPWTTMDSMQLTFNPWVEGSIPSRLTTFHRFAADRHGLMQRRLRIACNHFATEFRTCTA